MNFNYSILKIIICIAFGLNFTKCYSQNNYCIPNPPSGVNGHSISHVKLESLDTTFVGATYQYFSDSLHHETCFLKPGSTYKIYLKSGSQAVSTLAAWIDWNNNMTFGITEKLGEFTTSSPNQIDSISFTVPQNNTNGKLWLRVRSSNSTAINSCNSYNSGETIDFTITVLNPFYEYDFFQDWEFSGTGNNYIYGISLNNINNQSSGGSNGPVYSDFSNLISLISECSSNYLFITGNFSLLNDSVLAYIDFNNNGIFEGNEILGKINLSSGYYTDSILFNSPSVAGDFRLRILYYSNLKISEVEDYTVSILNSNFVSAPRAQIGSDLFYSCENNCLFYGCIGQNIFYDYGCGQPTYRKWSVPGAIPSTSSLQNPIFNFSNAGTYNITLIDSNSFGSDTVTVQVYISPSITNINLGSNTLICSGDSFLLSAPAGNPLIDCYTYLWSTGATSREIYVRESGTYSIILNSCYHTDCPAYDTIVINLSPIKYNVTGGGSFCTGGNEPNIGLSYSETGISYRLYNNGNPIGNPVQGTGGSISFGSQSIAGTYTVIATNNSLSCTLTMNNSVNIIIVQPPSIYNVTGGGNYCSGGSGVFIGMNSSEINVNYQLYINGNISGTPISGTGNAIQFLNQTVAGIYTVVASINNSTCFTSMAGSVFVNIIPSPIAYNVTGGGSFCIGSPVSPIGLSDSDPGINYRLYKNGIPVGSPVPGTGNGLTFGIQSAAAAYSVVATNSATTCTTLMSGIVNVIINSFPVSYRVIGGGNYCSDSNGVAVGIDSSEMNVNYQLYRNGIFTGDSILGNGNSILFPNQLIAGFYTIIGTTINSSCSLSMIDSVYVNKISLPAVYNLSGGGRFCNGSPLLRIILSDSNYGIAYELYKDGITTGIIISGTDSIINFSHLTASGNYTIFASDSFACKSKMSGSVNLNIIPAPTAFILSGGGDYCSGDSMDSIKLSGSEVWIRYQLYVDSNPVGNSLNGNGNILNYGIQGTPGRYFVIGSNTITSCIATMTGTPVIKINQKPTIYNVTGGGQYCNGEYGVIVGLSNSQSTFHYQLYNNNFKIDTPIIGNGGPLSFGFQLFAGNYSVIATNPDSTCTSQMNDTAIVIANQLPIPRITTILPDTICILNAPIRLEGVPPGGIFSGDGVVNDTLFPLLSGAETVLIYYDYTNPITGCSAYSSEDIFVDYCNGIEEYEFPGTITLFPNPADNEIITDFFFNRETELSIEIINGIGQRVRFINLNKIVGRSTYSIFTSSISNGFYLIKFNLDHTIFTKKILINH